MSKNRFELILQLLYISNNEKIEMINEAKAIKL